MAGALDAAMRTVASTLHKTFGKEVTATIRSTNGYNPAEGYAETTESTATVYGVVGRFKKHELMGDIRASDLKFTMADQDNTAPQTDDAFTIDSVEYEVVAVMPQYSGEQVAYWTVALRA